MYIHIMNYRGYQTRKKKKIGDFYNLVIGWILKCGGCTQNLRQINANLKGQGLKGLNDWMSVIFTGSSCYNFD